MMFFCILVVFFVEFVIGKTYSSLVHDHAIKFIDLIRLKRTSIIGGNSYLTWLLAVLIPSVSVFFIYVFLSNIHPIFGSMWDILVLSSMVTFVSIIREIKNDIHLLNNGKPELGEIIPANEDDKPADNQSCTDYTKNLFCNHLLSCFTSVFNILFFYIIFPGASGSVFYFIASNYADRLKSDDKHPFVNRAIWLNNLLEWIPARLFALSLALGSHFDASKGIWRNSHKSFGNSNKKLIFETAIRALAQTERSVKQSRQKDNLELIIDKVGSAGIFEMLIKLVSRALCIWVALIGLCTLILFIN